MIIKPLKRLILPTKNLVRGPNGGLLRSKVDNTSLAGSINCCCDTEKSCDFYYGNGDGTYFGVHPHAPAVEVEFDTPITEPVSAPCSGCAGSTCCESLPTLFQLPIRNYDDADTDALAKFGVCPGDWIENCWSDSANCYEDDPEGPNSTYISMHAVCGEGGYSGGEPAAACSGPCDPDVPEGEEAIWTVLLTGEGSNDTLNSPCSWMSFRYIWQCTRPIGTVTDFSGEWTLDWTSCSYWDHPTLPNQPYNYLFCTFPSTLTLRAGTSEV